MARKQLKDSAGTNFYPYTDTDSVIDGNNNTLSDILSDLNTSVNNRLKYVLCTDESEYESIVNKDANTLYLIPAVVIE